MPEQYRSPAETRTLQKQAAAVLAALLAQDLPCACWTITDTAFMTGKAKLDGQVSGNFSYTDEDRRAELDTWASYLEAPVEWSPLHSNSPTLSGQVSVEIDGVLVEVWTHVTAPKGGVV